ncbi:nonsense-mediated mRNA decay factor SMG9-like isoform X2 [Planococcus citri]|uniref:nonsense-mediated mRNA decay factor SMG9-like isoform X2 n=1 Tax=Planococcus citri TaxID=170843 RepID=UPI0031F79C57
MDDYDRKEYNKRKKNLFVGDKDEKPWLKPSSILLSKHENDKEKKIHVLHEGTSQPTIILKTRDGETRALSPNQAQQMSSTIAKPKKDAETYNVAIKSKSVLAKNTIPTNGLLTVPSMTGSLCLIEDGQFTGDGVLDYLTEHNEFLVIGCLGLQGVGKSTLMSKLCGNAEKKEIFKLQNQDNIVTCTHCTSSIDLFVSKNRIFFLDTPPLLSPSLMDKIIYQESKKAPFSSAPQPFSGGSQISCGDFSSTENALEIISLQTAAFILSVCHVVILVQDWFYDPNLLRFLQTAEMLKPPMPTTSHNEELTEYFPHVVFLQNKAQYSDYTQSTISTMQDMYSQTFLRSRLQIQSGIGMANGTIINHLNSCSCGDPINLYVLPDLDADEKSDFVDGHPGFCNLLEKLKKDVFGIPKNPLTHAPLSEKNWFHYSSKVWEAIKSSSFFHEYDRLLSKHE